MPSFSAWHWGLQFSPPDSEKLIAIAFGTALLNVPSVGFHGWVVAVFLVAVFMLSIARVVHARREESINPSCIVNFFSHYFSIIFQIVLQCLIYQ